MRLSAPAIGRPWLGQVSKSLRWLPLLVAAGGMLQVFLLRRGIARAQALSAGGQRFERRMTQEGLRILVLGDSTGVGIGADRPEESIAGLLADEFPDADIVNVSRSGARMADVVAQARLCSSSGLHFDVAFLHVGGNDILRSTPAQKLADDCEQLMAEMPRLSARTVWLGPPNLGIAPLFPWPFSWLMTTRSRAAAALFARSAGRHGVTFVDFSSREHEARLSRRRAPSFSVDGLHPNSSTYRYGYTVARQALESELFAKRRLTPSEVEAGSAAVDEPSPQATRPDQPLLLQEECVTVSV